MTNELTSSKTTFERVQSFLLLLSFGIALLLLARFTVDFYIEMPVWLAVPFSLLVFAALVVAGINLRRVFTGNTEGAVPKWMAVLLMASIPFGFLASTLDCSGLAPNGCTPFCTFIKLGWIPLMTICSALYLVKPKNELLLVIGLMSFVTLAPHCVCFNVGNGWWIERLGASPMCYIWGFTVCLISLSAIKSRRLLATALLINAAIIGGGLAFFISHHYFHFPW